MTTPGTEMGRSGNTVDTGATGRTGEVGGPGGGEVGGPGGGERDVTIGRLDGAQIDLLEPLWRSLIDHIRELGSVVSLVPHEQSWPRRRAIYQELFADGESFALGAWRGEQLVGYAMIHIAPPDAVWFTGSRYAELTSLCLAPAERGDGLGTELLDAVEAGLLERGLDEYVIGVDSVNDGARRFYERRGFRDGFHLMHGWIGDVRSGVRGDVRGGDATAAATPTAAVAGGDEDVETPETASFGID
jgi:ribosomal protein S18 acetylase RimI-like enzyme